MKPISQLSFSFLVVLSFVSAAFAQQSEKPRLILIGDSTVKNGQGRGDGGLWGWGQVLPDHFDTGKVDVENHAIGGRSSRTFLTEGRWDRVLERLRPGDLVIMQFGHNDGGERFKGDRPRASLKGNGDETEEGVVEMTGEQEVVHSYGWYLRKYIADVKAKGATPIVCSLVPRDRWNDGHVIRSDKDYGLWAAKAADQGGALFIDLNEIVAKRYEQLGEQTVNKLLFTEKDWTHTTKAGAEVTAQCLAGAIRDLKDCQLADYLLSGEKDTTTPQTSWHFDFREGEATEGAIKVSPTAVYSDDTGYGFEPAVEVITEALGEDLDLAFQDGTHHTNYGSYLFAKCVVQSIRDLQLDLADHITNDFASFDPQHPDKPEIVRIPLSRQMDSTKTAGS